jgi:hypothetical protein
MATPTSPRTTTREVDIKARRKKGAGRFSGDCEGVEGGGGSDDDDRIGGASGDVGGRCEL